MLVRGVGARTAARSARMMIPDVVSTRTTTPPRPAATALFKDLLINVTSFFREPAAWRAAGLVVARHLRGLCR